MLDHTTSFEDQGHRLKIVMVGDSNVGKTSIVHRIQKERLPLKDIPTVGVQFSNKNMVIDNERYIINIWDTSGQQRYRAVVSQHYRQAQGCIVVYDVTKASSFNAAKEWLKEAQDKAPENCVFMLVGNKLDKLEFGNLPKTEQLSFAKSIRAVSFEEASKFAEFNRVLWREVSALTGQNIQSAFADLIDRIIEEKEKNLSPHERKHIRLKKPQPQKQGCKC